MHDAALAPPLALKTKRTVLRKISLEDAAAWKSFNNRIAKRMAGEGLAWPGVPSIVYARNEILHYLQMWDRGERYVYAITDRASGKVIGDFHLKSIDRRRRRAEFGHALAPEAWGTGITHETLDAIARMLRSRGYTPWCQVETENIRSWRSLEKHKAIFKGTRRVTIGKQAKSMRVYEL